MPIVFEKVSVEKSAPLPIPLVPDRQARSADRVVVCAGLKLTPLTFRGALRNRIDCEPAEPKTAVSVAVSFGRRRPSHQLFRSPSQSRGYPTRWSARAAMLEATEIAANKRILFIDAGGPSEQAERRTEQPSRAGTAPRRRR